MDELRGQVFLATLPLIIARLTPIVIFTPLFGGAAASRRFRTGVVLALGIAFAIMLSRPGAPALPTGLEYALLVAKEAMIGAVFAVFLIFAFQIAASVGALIDLGRGASIATALDPMTKQQTPVTGTMLLMLLVTAFVSLGGYFLVFDALATSFVSMPISVLEPSGLTQGNLGRAALTTFGTFFELTIRLAAPVLVVVLLIDVGLGLINRVTPQIQVFFLGITVKGWIGLAVLLLALGVAMGEMNAWIAGTLNVAMQALGGA